MKKKILIVLGIILVIVIAVVGIMFFKGESNYTLEDVQKIIEKSYEKKDNMYMASEYFDEQGNSLAKTETYINGNITCSKQYSKSELEAELIINSNDNSLYTIMHKEKNIYFHSNYPIDTNLETNEFIYSAARNETNENQGIYEYIGKEEIDGKECIKVSLTDIVDDLKSVTNYYIDINSGYILKSENIEDGKVIMSLVNTYEIGTVTDENASGFDISKYPEYTLVED